METTRPPVLTIICLLVFIGAAVSIPLRVSAVLHGDGSWYPLLIVLDEALGLVAFIGLWKMKKWSIVLYTLTYAIAQGVLLVTGGWNLLGLMLTVIVIVTGFYYYRRMT